MDAVISLIVPVYNVEPYLEGCLRSVFDQKGTIPMELILVDDCGSDTSMQIAENLLPEAPGNIQCHILHHECNRGLSAARNTGTAVAKGEYILYLDSDDQLTPDACSVLLQLIEQSKADMAIGGIQLSAPAHDHFFDIPAGEWKGEASAKAVFSRTVRPMAWNKLIRLSYLRQHGLLFKEGLLHEDEHWIARVALSHPHIVATSHPTYLYRNQRPGSIMSAVSLRHILSKLIIASDIAELLRHERGEVKEQASQWILLHVLNALLLQAKDAHLPLDIHGRRRLLHTSYLVARLCSRWQRKKWLLHHPNQRYRRVAHICRLRPALFSGILLYFYFRKKLSS